jgi:hypothetical protein
MLLKLAPQAEAELDHIWNYIAQKSGSFEIADHLIDSIEAALLCFLPTRTWAGDVTRNCGLVCAVFPSRITSLSIGSTAIAC